MKNIKCARIYSIEIRGMKNILEGMLDFYSESQLKSDPNCLNSHIYGIYGPNGTGKTGVIEACKILKTIFSGHLPDEDAYSQLKKVLKKYINSTTKKLFIEVKMYFEIDQAPVFYDYAITFDNSDGQLYISSEILKSKNKSEGEWERWKTIFSYSDDLLYSNEINKRAAVEDPLSFQIHTLRKTASLTSVLMNPLFLESLKMFESADFINIKKMSVDSLKIKKIEDAIETLRCFSEFYMVVIGADHFNMISGGAVPLFITSDDPKNYLYGQLPLLSLESARSSAPAEAFNSFKILFDQVNIILQTLVPGTILELKNLQKIKQANAPDIIEYECVSKHGDNECSLCCESEGIKRLICLINTFIAFTSNPSYCLFIDSFDSCIFEHVFGTLLESLETCGKGQLIFTAHNLYGLEKLPYKQIIFSTENPKNRFECQSAIMTNDYQMAYFRNLILGKEKGESLGSIPMASEFRNAFRKANRCNFNTCHKTPNE